MIVYHLSRGEKGYKINVAGNTSMGMVSVFNTREGSQSAFLSFWCSDKGTKMGPTRLPDKEMSGHDLSNNPKTHKTRPKTPIRDKSTWYVFGVLRNTGWPHLLTSINLANVCRELLHLTHSRTIYLMPMGVTR